MGGAGEGKDGVRGGGREGGRTGERGNEGRGRKRGEGKLTLMSLHSALHLYSCNTRGLYSLHLAALRGLQADGKEQRREMPVCKPINNSLLWKILNINWYKLPNSENQTKNRPPNVGQLSQTHENPFKFWEGWDGKKLGVGKFPKIHLPK